MYDGKYNKAYVEYLAHFHGSRDWFECHEIMETQWKQESFTHYKRQWLMLIQIAVGLYHERRGNLQGATKMLARALHHAKHVDWHSLGVDGAVLQQQLGLRKQTLATYLQQQEQQQQHRSSPIHSPTCLLCKRSAQENNSDKREFWEGNFLIKTEFTEWNFPIYDRELIAVCTAYCIEKGWTWCMVGSQACKEVTDRHLLRNRTAVIQARQEAKALKKANRATKNK